MTCTLVVRRPPPGGLGDPYPITLWLDRARLGVLMPGESLRHEVAAGVHELRGSNTLVSRRERFESRDGEELAFVAYNRPGWATTFFALLGAGSFSLGLEREPAAAAATTRPPGG